MSNTKKFDAGGGTVFMGPASQREMKVEAIIRSQNSTWDEETEAKYMESIRNKATAKVRAMLLQAQKRSNEIIEQAEIQAKDLQMKLENEIKLAEEYTSKAKAEYESSYEKASQLAQSEMLEQLASDQKQLGESTAVVLLSIHQQLQKIYDAWKEELRLLTIEAINVGTGWVLDSQREEILSTMLDESIKKLTEKRDYIVRVHPTDGALVTQVLENSKEKSWSMEVNPDLDPGSLEIENSYSFIKNSSKERKEFVQDILNNLTLPSNGEEQEAVQEVTSTLMNEIQENPLLASATSENSAENVNMEQESNVALENHVTEQDLANNTENLSDDLPLQTQEQASPAEIAQKLSEQDFSPTVEELASQEVAEHSQAEQGNSTEPSLSDAPADFENSPQLVEQGESLLEQSPPPPREENPPLINPEEEAEHLVDAFLSDVSSDLPPAGNSIDDITENMEVPQSFDQSEEVQANDLQQGSNQEKQEEAQTTDHSLPDNLADDLLAEMGFDDDKK